MQFQNAPGDRVRNGAQIGERDLRGRHRREADETLPHIADKGSFTLISGVLTDEHMHGGTVGTTINHMVEGFVKAAAVELPRRRRG